MSGFVGIVHWSDERPLQRPAADLLERALAASGRGRPTVHSAPPAHAAICRQAAAPEGRPSHRPGAADGLLSLFDGRLDDREALAGRLALPPGGMSDGDLAAAAYRRWGADASRELLGEFAWAVWDGGARRLVLARDTSMSWSLYACRGDGFVAFATRLPALFFLPEVPREPDDQGLAEFVAHHPGQGERTVYRDILRVMPGTTLVIDRHGLRRSRNWEPRRVPVPRDPAACAEAAREVFGRAMRSRLQVPGPAAVSLSGGLDSAIVAAEAARQRGAEPVHGFVLVPPPDVPLAVPKGWTADERPQVASLARRWPNLRIELIEPQLDPLDLDPTALFLATGQPIGLSPNIGWLLSAWRAARSAGAGLMLTGDGGEMSLTHRGSLRAVARQGHLRHALREAWRLHRLQGGGIVGQLDRAFLGGHLSRLRDRERRSWPGDWRRYSPIRPELAESAGIRELLLAERFPGGFLHRPPGYAEALAIHLRWRAPSVEVVAALRQLSGLDHSCPFADRRVLEFCLSLPETMFVREGQHRWLARAAFRDLLPPEIRDNPRKGAQNPQWFHRLTGHRAAMRAQLERIETSPLANRALDVPRLKSLLESWPSSAEEAEAAGPAYRSTLLRGLHAGAFLRWVDPDNRG